MTEALQNPLPPDSVACPRFHLSSVLLWFGFHKSEPVSISPGQWPGLHHLSPKPAGEGDHHHDGGEGIRAESRLRTPSLSELPLPAPCWSSQDSYLF